MSKGEIEDLPEQEGTAKLRKARKIIDLIRRIVSQNMTEAELDRLWRTITPKEHRQESNQPKE